MGIIPLEKLIDYKGNRYELTRAMIDLAKKGGKLLSYETKYSGGKYIQVAIKNILDGKIKYGYDADSSMSVDEYAPFKTSDESYDESVYAKEVGEVEVKEDDDDEESPLNEMDMQLAKLKR